MKRNQQVKRISRIMILTLLLSVCSAAAVPSGATAKIKPAAGKSYSETKIGTTSAWDLYVNAKGKIRFITDSWEQQVYGISGGKVVKKPKDPMVKAANNAFDYVKIEDETDMDIRLVEVSMNKKGTAGYFATWKKIFRYNKKGKITKVFNPSKKLGVKKVFVGRVRWVKKDLVAAEFTSTSKKVPSVCLIDMKKGKIVKKYKKKYSALCATDGKNLYVRSGSVEKKTEKIVKIKAASGKKLASISTAPIYKLAAGRMEAKSNKDSSSIKYLRDDSAEPCYANGKLYLQYLTGIYTWDGKGKDFKTVLDGGKNGSYTWFNCRYNDGTVDKGNYGCPYCTAFQVDRDGTMYILTRDWGTGEDMGLYIYKAS